MSRIVINDLNSANSSLTLKTLNYDTTSQIRGGIWPIVVAYYMWHWDDVKQGFNDANP